MRSSTIEKKPSNSAEKQKRRRKPRTETQSEKNNNEKKSFVIISRIFTVLFSLGTIGIILDLFLLYGPYKGFREWLVTTAMTTMTHQYFATWFMMMKP